MEKNACLGFGRCRTLVETVCRLWLEKFTEDVLRQLETCKRFDARTLTGSAGPLIDQFVADRCLVAPGARIGAAAAYRAFVAWFSKIYGEQPEMSLTAFGKSLSHRFPKGKISGCIIYKGLGLKP